MSVPITRMAMDQRISTKMYNDLFKCINYYAEEFDLNEYEIVGTLYWVLTEVTRDYHEEDSDDSDD